MSTDTLHARAMLCRCPDCHAQPGKLCTAVHRTTATTPYDGQAYAPGEVLGYVHRARIDAAQAGQMPLIRGAA